MGGSNALDLAGRRFGRLTVLALAESPAANRNRYRHWIAQCDCGNQCVVRSSRLNTGATQSCGCLRIERIKRANTQHGMTRTLTFKAWGSMLERCTNPRNSSYPRYGGRGITVCERWAKFENFLADMGEKPDGMSLDRKDNEGNYEPNNCRWATAVQQARNRSTNRQVTFGGETLTVAEWAERAGVSQGSIYQRLAKGWPIDRAVTAPPSGTRPRRTS